MDSSAWSDADLAAITNQAISAFGTNPGADPNQLIDNIKAYCGDEPLAVALYRFIPIAYCRLFIPEPVYPDEFVLVVDQNTTHVTFSFSADRVYSAVLTESRKRLDSLEKQDDLWAIFYHSADFKAINDALNHGAPLTDLICSPTYFVK
ncbi:MAG: hypothetical protein H7Z72_06690 [Bacteroidetes bacterium]|nr:hypothetical protein [Fibrella sp.]